MAWLKLRLDRKDEAYDLFTRAQAIWEKSLGVRHPYIATALAYEASILYRRGKFAESAAFFERAITISERTIGPEHPELGSMLLARAAAVRKLGDMRLSRELRSRGQTILLNYRRSNNTRLTVDYSEILRGH